MLLKCFQIQYYHRISCRTIMPRFSMVFLQIPDILAKISQHQERKNKERHDKEAKERQDKDTATLHLTPSGARVLPLDTVDPRPPLPAPADPPLPAFVTPLPARLASPVALVLQPPPPAHPPPEVARCTTVYVTWWESKNQLNKEDV